MIVDTEELDELEIDAARAMSLYHGDHPASEIHDREGATQTPA